MNYLLDIHMCACMYHELFIKDPQVYVYVPWTLYQSTQDP